MAAAILESSPAYAATLSALVADAGWEARTHLEFHQLVRSIEAAGAQLVFISSRDLPPEDTALSVVRSTFAGPLVVLVDDEDELKIRLRQGATLVVQKPFDLEYLELAVRAVLARTEPVRRALGQAAVLGDLRVRLADHTVERRGRRQVLGPAEWQLFAFLMAHPHRILNRSELARGAWGAELPGREAEVELYVSRLRHKIELNPRYPDLILTIRGRGYQLNAVPEPMMFASATTGTQSVPPPTTMLGYWQGAYEELVRVQTKPAVIGHSFGGLLVQIIAGRGLSAATVAIDPAPFRGVLPLPFSALKSASPVLGNPANRNRAIPLTYEQFRYGFANAVSEDEAKQLYETFAVPASGAPLFQAATANLNPRTEAKVDSKNPDRGPLLIISGEKDNTAPWAIANASYKRQKRNQGVTEITEMPNRGHGLVIDSGWREVADTALAFVKRFVN